jgi:hypothetical protein
LSAGGFSQGLSDLVCHERRKVGSRRLHKRSEQVGMGLGVSLAEALIYDLDSRIEVFGGRHVGLSHECFRLDHRFFPFKAD